MKAPPFTYHSPATTAEVVDLLGSLENARVLGGGQSLMPMLNLRVAGPDHLIDLGRVEGLVGVEAREGSLAIRAMTTQRAVEFSEVVRRCAPLLGQAVDHVGHQQTRNRGTLGGSICHLDPGAELPVAAAALDAVLVAEGGSGRRRIPFSEFALGYLTNALEPDELLVEVELTRALPRSGSAFMEFNRRPADFAIVSVAVQLSLDDRDQVAHAAVALGGVHYAPVRMTYLEQAIMGSPVLEDVLTDALRPLAEFDADGDELYPPAFRLEIGEVLVRRAVKAAFDRARGAA